MNVRQRTTRCFNTCQNTNQCFPTKRSALEFEAGTLVDHRFESAFTNVQQRLFFCYLWREIIALRRFRHTLWMIYFNPKLSWLFENRKVKPLPLVCKCFSLFAPNSTADENLDLTALGMARFCDLIESVKHSLDVFLAQIVSKATTLLANIHKEFLPLAIFFCHIGAIIAHNTKARRLC